MKQNARKNRGKLIITIIALLLILFAMGMGVYAVVSGKTDIEGTVTYYANSVSAGVYGHIDGYQMGREAIEDFSANFSPSSPQGTEHTWDIGNVWFSIDESEWQYRVGIIGDQAGLPMYSQSKQPTITIRLAVFNYAVYDENNLDKGRIYIGNIVEPPSHDNLIYTYRMGYGKIDSNNLNWRSSFDDLSTLSGFTVQEREYFSASKCYLNSSEDNMYLPARTSEDMSMSAYLLEFKIRVMDTTIPINEFSTSLKINLSSSPLSAE